MRHCQSADLGGPAWEGHLDNARKNRQGRRGGGTGTSTLRRYGSLWPRVLAGSRSPDTDSYRLRRCGRLRPAVRSGSGPLGPTITGSADTSSAVPVAGVVVGFKAEADLGSCAACGLHTAVTNAGGTYSITLPAGIYEALCAKRGQTCEVNTNPPVAAARVTVYSNVSLNFLVAGPTPAPQPDPQPSETQAGPDGTTVSGHMYYANGQPVVGAAIVFADMGCAGCDSQPHVTTGPDGSYSITLDNGTYQAQCDYIPGCGVQDNSSGQGQTVNVPPGGTVNFTACEPNAGLAYPQCLQS